MPGWNRGGLVKIRCPYCKQTIDRVRNGLCPVCSKAVRPPDPPIREDYVPRARRAPSLSMGGPFSIFSIFSQRPGFVLWVLGIGAIVVAATSMLKVDVAMPLRAVTYEETTFTELGSLSTALEWFRQTCKRYPTTEEGLNVLDRDPGIPGWVGPYVYHVPNDLWGNPFNYSCSNDTVCVSSSGFDGKQGTADDIIAPAPDYKAVMARRVITTQGTN